MNIRLPVLAVGPSNVFRRPARVSFGLFISSIFCSGGSEPNSKLLLPLRKNTKGFREMLGNPESIEDQLEGFWLMIPTQLTTHTINRMFSFPNLG